VLRTDSSYAVANIIGHLAAWVKLTPPVEREQGILRRSKGVDVTNADLFLSIWELIQHVEVRFEHVYGHKKEPGNEAAHKLATEALNKLRIPEVVLTNPLPAPCSHLVMRLQHLGPEITSFTCQHSRLPIIPNDPSGPPAEPPLPLAFRTRSNVQDALEWENRPLPPAEEEDEVMESVDEVTLWVDPSSEDENPNSSLEELPSRADLNSETSPLDEEPYFPNFEGNPIETGPYPADLFRLMTALPSAQQTDPDLSTLIGRLGDET
jgi:hypothetical protein